MTTIQRVTTLREIDEDKEYSSRSPLEKQIENIAYSTFIGITGDVIGNCTGRIASYFATRIGLISDTGLESALHTMCQGIHEDNFYRKAIVTGPIKEELICRVGIQQLLLKHLLQYTIKKVAPENEKLLDTQIATIARVILSATIFSLLHLNNKGVFPDSYVFGQLIAIFFTGITYGTLAESSGGLLSTIFAHSITNALALMHIETQC